MPTISINRRDLQTLLARGRGRGQGQGKAGALSLADIEGWLPLVKGEVKDHDPETDELRVELADSNRPDLWSCEGIARQIRAKLAGKGDRYPFFTADRSAKHRVRVVPGMEEVRPFVAACTASGYRVTDEGLAQLIQVQEKLAEIYGRKRRTVSIGLYRLERIAFPVTYDLVKPDEARFTPLGFDEKMSLGEILAIHPKGLEYGHLIGGHDRLPLLRDEEGQVLSLPPIINSREIGEVRVGDTDLFVEVTGGDLVMVALTLNILAANLADRGATIRPVQVAYPYRTAWGATVRSPLDFGKPRTIAIKAIEAALGQSLSGKLVQEALQAYGYEAKLAGGRVSVKLPPYRNDLMHAVDVIEDVAISCGYAAFGPIMPSQFTVGSLSRPEQASDRVRDLMVGLGFQEIVANILGAREDFCDRMRLAGTPWSRVVEVDNVMSQSFGCLRQWITPSLLRAEAASTRSFYPHRVFEVGEVAQPASAEGEEPRTALVLGAVIAHAAANFSEIHSCLDLLLFYLDVPYSLEVLEHPSFLEGRSGRILIDGKPVGVIGELHPEVLERWQITMPTVTFELEIGQLAE